MDYTCHSTMRRVDGNAAVMALGFTNTTHKRWELWEGFSFIVHFRPILKTYVEFNWKKYASKKALCRFISLVSLLISNRRDNYMRK